MITFKAVCYQNPFIHTRFGNKMFANISYFLFLTTHLFYGFILAHVAIFSNFFLLFVFVAFFLLNHQKFSFLCPSFESFTFFTNSHIAHMLISYRHDRVINFIKKVSFFFIIIRITLEGICKVLQYLIKLRFYRIIEVF